MIGAVWIELVDMQTEKLVTGKELILLPDIGRCELVAGKVVQRPYHTMAEGAVISNLCFSIESYNEKTGIILVGGCGIYTDTNPDTVRGMDIAYYSADRWKSRKIAEDYLILAPDLIVEVPSPTESFYTVTTKLREYFAVGVRLVWVADTEAHIVYATVRQPMCVSSRKGRICRGMRCCRGSVWQSASCLRIEFRWVGIGYDYQNPHPPKIEAWNSFTPKVVLVRDVVPFV